MDREIKNAVNVDNRVLQNGEINDSEYTINNKKYRNIGLDILRILAMIMIVCLHVSGKGQFLVAENNANFYKIISFFEIICIVAVNCYVLITGYFQVNSKFKIKKIINIWAKVLFYSIGIYIVLLILGQVKFSIKDTVKSFFPILLKDYWFVNCYLLLYVLSPFINKMIKSLNKKELQTLLAVLLIVFCGLTSILPERFVLDNTNGYGIIWFIVLYLVGAYIRLYVKANYRNKINILAFFLTSIFTYILLFVIKYMCNIMQISDVSNKVYAYNFVTVFLAAIFLFLFFKNLNIKNKKFINIISKVAPLTFGVYIIHEQVVLREHLYLDILKLGTFWNNPIQFLIIPITVIEIFIACIFIEKITQNTFQKWIHKILEIIFNKLKKTKCYIKMKNRILEKSN